MEYGIQVTEILQLILIVVTIWIAISQMRRTSNWNRQNATVNYINNYDKLIESLSNDIIEKFKLSDYETVCIDTNDIEAIISNTEQQKDLSRVVHYYEVLCVGMRLGYYDKRIAHKLFYADLVGTYGNIEKYIKIRRRQMNNENIGINFECIYHQWESKKLNEEKK